MNFAFLGARSHPLVHRCRLIISNPLLNSHFSVPFSTAAYCATKNPNSLKKSPLGIKRARKGDAAHLVLRLITWKHVPAGQFLVRLGMTINYSKPHLIGNTMSCVVFDSRDSSAAFRLSPARGVAMTSMLRIKNAADSS